jgi:hypothetical protein
VKHAEILVKLRSQVDAWTLSKTQVYD